MNADFINSGSHGRPGWRLTIAATGEEVIFGTTQLLLADGVKHICVGGEHPDHGDSGTVCINSTGLQTYYAHNVGCRWIMLEAPRTVHADKSSY